MKKLCGVGDEEWLRAQSNQVIREIKVKKEKFIFILIFFTILERIEIYYCPFDSSTTGCSGILNKSR